jgi:ATP-dependent Lon protease
MTEETRDANETGATRVLPLLPLKSAVLFPRLATSITVGRPKSIEAVRAALAAEEKTLVVTAQRDAAVEDPLLGDLHPIGTRAIIKQMARAEEGMRILIAGIERVEIEALEQTDPYHRARVRPIAVPIDTSIELEARQRAVADLGQQILEILQPDAGIDAAQLVAEAPDPLQLAYMVASMLPLDVGRAQAILDATTRLDALRLLNEYLVHELRVLKIRKEIAGNAATEMSKSQREYVLRQQMRAIQEELGEADPQQAEAGLLRDRLGKADLPEPVRKEVERELSRLERMQPAAPDYQITRAYVELVLELPWKSAPPQDIDLEKARRVLDEDHYDLDDVKQRILEELAVMKLNPAAHAPILCFVGPPGVGKTSLGQSIARALDRKFERLSLGGMHDESELRGHRRTYIGAMPGRILQSVRRAGVRNPLLMLDEVDKLGHGFHGDPAAALLEILDPAQNNTFRDNYLDMPYDLSQIFFITTANTLDTIPRPLLDRMELLRLSGYSREEKVFIARRYLIPRRLKEAGLTPEQVTIDDAALERIIARFTREAGVRELERVIGRLTRKAAMAVAEGSKEGIAVTPDKLPDLLGDERFLLEEARDVLPPGVATGLAWTETGGEVLYVEATLLPDGKDLRVTGSLGDVMRESATAAQSYVWSHASDLGIDPARIQDNGVHLHMPAGAVPKDGPSAGVAMVTALASVYSGVPARRDTAMTGEISLAGLVLPVGGIKEKVLAAHRAGLRRVVLPKANERDLRQVPEGVRSDLKFFFAERIADALQSTLTDPGRLRSAVEGVGTGG